MNEDIVIGATVHGGIIYSIGDTLCLTPIIEALSKQKNQLITVSTSIPELFYNNPYVKEIVNTNNLTIDISHSLPYYSVEYSSNVVEFYAERVGITLPKEHKPKIYLDDDELEYGRNQLREYEGFKRIAVCITTLADCKNLRYEYMTPFLDRLRDRGYKLFGIGREKFENRYDWDKSFIDQTTIREACSIINFCHLYLGVDAGLYHIAAALDVPQVIFFRNNQSANNSYLDTYNIESRIKCEGGCLARHLLNCQTNNRCMDNFDLDRYYNLITKVLPI
jgi:ADP-heptose:LPS heptosyltransferase